MQAMSDKTSGAAETLPKDPLGVGAVLSEIVKKLSSQALLFGLAVIVIIVAAWYLFGSQAGLVIGAVLIVFVAALLGYLFIEQRRTVESEALAWIGQSVRKASPADSGAGGAFAIELWTESVRRGSVTSRDIGVVAAPARAYRVGDPIVVKF